MTAQKTTKKGTGKKILVAAILGVLAGMLLAPKAGKKLRKDLKDVAQKMEKEIIRQAGRTKKLTQEKYEEIVETMVNSYTKVKKIKKEDVRAMTRNLKKIWTDLVKKIKSR